MASRVEYILTAEDGQALRAAERLLQAARNTGDAFEQSSRRTQRSGTSAFDKMGKAALKFLGPASIAAGAVKFLQNEFQQLEQRAAAIQAEAAKASAVGQGLGANLANFASNRPGGAEDAAELERSIIQILASPVVALEDGANRLGAAATAVQSSLPEADLKDIVGILRETAESGTLAQGADLSGIATALAKLQDLGGLSPNQAQQFARQSQVASQVGDSSAFASAITPILSLASAQNVKFEQALGLFGFITKSLGDSDGSKSSTALIAILNKLASGSEKAGKFGLEFDSENAFDRLIESAEFLRTATEEQRGNFRSAFAEGAAGGTVATRLATEDGLRALADDIRLVSSAPLDQDRVVSEIQKLREASPSFAEAFDALQAQSQFASQRLGDVQEGESAGTFREVLAEALQRAELDARSQEVVLGRFDTERAQGSTISESLDNSLRNLGQLDRFGSRFLDSFAPLNFVRADPNKAPSLFPDTSARPRPFDEVVEDSESLQKLVPILEKLSATQGALSALVPAATPPTAFPPLEQQQPAPSNQPTPVTVTLEQPAPSTQLVPPVVQRLPAPAAEPDNSLGDGFRDALADLVKDSGIDERRQEIVLDSFDREKELGFSSPAALQRSFRNVAGRDQFGAGLFDRIVPDSINGLQGGFRGSDRNFERPFSEVAADSPTLQAILTELRAGNNTSATNAAALAQLLEERRQQTEEGNDDRRRSRRVLEDYSTPRRELRQGVDAFGGGR